MCVCVFSSFPITSLSIHPRVPSQLWKMPASASPGQPWRRSQPTPLHCLRLFQEGRQPISETAKPRPGSLRGWRRGASSLRAGPTSFICFPSERGTCRTDRQARCRVATELAVSGRSYTSSAWLSGLHLVMKSSLDLFLFFKLFYYGI